MLVAVTLAWALVLGALGFQAQQAADPVSMLKAATAVAWAQDSASISGPKREPDWDIPDPRPVPEDPEVVEEARECLAMYSEPISERKRIWYEAKRLVFIPPQAPAVEYLGLTFTGPGGEAIIILSNTPARGRSTMVHEAVHALCEDGCPHNRTQVSRLCGLGF